jgi:hypothetical protein
MCKCVSVLLYKYEKRKFIEIYSTYTSTSTTATATTSILTMYNYAVRYSYYVVIYRTSYVYGEYELYRA